MKRSVWIAKGALAIADQGIFSGSGFLLSLLLARWLTPTQYGAYALSFSVFLFASGFHNALILEPMGVLGAASYAGSLPAYIAKLVRMHTAVASALFALVVGGAGAVLLISRNTNLAAALCGAAFAVPCVLLSWLLRQSAYLDRRPALAVRGGTVYAVTLIACVILARSLGWLNPFSAFLAQACAGAIAGSYLIKLIRPDFRPAPAVQMRTVLAAHWKYGRWVIVTAFVYWLSAQAYYFIAAGELGIVDVASLRALQNFFLPFSQFLTSLTLLVIPGASSRFASKDKQAFQRVISHITILFTGGGLLYLLAVSVFGNQFMILIYNGKYAQSSTLLPIVGLSVVFTAGAMGATIGVRAMQRPSDVFVGYTTSSICTILAGFWMTRHWGLRGAVIGIAASSACFLITVVIRYRVRIRTEWQPYHPGDVGSNGPAVRVAWLFPSMARAFYWQPVLRAFARYWPESTVYTCIWPGDLPGYKGSLRLRVLPNFKFISLRKNKDGYNQGFFALPISIVWELFNYRPDVIFVQGFSMWTIWALLYKGITGCRVILMWEGVSPSVVFSGSPLRLRLRRLMASCADLGISNMQLGVEYLRDILGMPESSLVHHPYEVPEPAVICSPDGNFHLPDMPRPLFLFVGSLIARKGWPYLLHAAKLLLDRGYTSFSIVLAGTGEDALQVRQRVASEQLERNIHLVGAVPYQNLGAYFQAADVFVFPTLEDTWGLVLLEAMVAGKPVLCSKYAGSREMVQDNVNGFIFDPREPEELAGYMEQFIRYPDLIGRFGARSAIQMAKYTPERAAMMLAGLVERTIGRPLVRPEQERTPGELCLDS